MIYFVIDAYIIHPLSYPISVVVSNINKTTATVNFVSYQQQKTCVFLYNISKFSAQVFCEKDGSKFHAIDVVGLQANTVYHIMIGKGIQWTSRTINSINGKLSSPSYQPASLTSFTTLPTDTVVDESHTAIYVGEVVGKGKMPQSHALVLVRNPKTQATWSTVANDLGNFALLLSDIQLTDEVHVTVWGPDGYIVLVQPMSLLRAKTTTIVLQSYE